MSRCRSCGTEIKWAKTETGKSMPLDPTPVPDGNVELVNGIAHVHGGADLEHAQATNTVLHKAHFATCPKYQGELTKRQRP